MPIDLLALTSGPNRRSSAVSWPGRSRKFGRIFTGDMVTLPLIHIPGSDGGYPMVLKYNSGSTMEDEASWVGLGWTLNPGALIESPRVFQMI